MNTPPRQAVGATEVLFSNDDSIMKFLFSLEDLPGAKPFMGECSHQVFFELKDGGVLRIGSTDDDVSRYPGRPHIWVDIVYPKR